MVQTFFAQAAWLRYLNGATFFSEELYHLYYSLSSFPFIICRINPTKKEAPYETTGEIVKN